LGMGGCNLDQRTLIWDEAQKRLGFPEKGFTVLHSSACAGKSEHVAALLKARCCVTATGGKRKWNALHFAVKGASLRELQGRSRRSSKEERTSVWDSVQRTMEVILAHAQPEEAKVLLAAPDAEHTPLMLAVELQAQEGVVRLLAERMVAAGTTGVTALSRRDGHLNSSLHLVASKDGKPEVLKTLLEVGDAAVRPATAAENATGITPLELVMEKVAQVWESPSTTAKAGKSKKAGEPEEPVLASTAHRSYGLLDQAVDRSVPAYREMVEYESVQRSAGIATEKAKSDEAPELLPSFPELLSDGNMEALLQQDSYFISLRDSSGRSVF